MCGEYGHYIPPTAQYKGIFSYLFSCTYVLIRYYCSNNNTGRYRAEVEHNVPYIQLGFNCLNDLLKNIPDVASLYTDCDGLLYVKAVPQEGSQHINELVHDQNTKKKPTENYNSFKTLEASTSAAPNRKFYCNNNNSWKMSQKPQSFFMDDNHSHLVPQLIQPTWPTQQFPSATHSPAVWNPRTYSPPPRPNPTTSFDKKDKKCSSKLSNTRYHIPAVSRLPEDRSHLKPQPMLPRTPASTTVSSPSPNAQSEAKVMPPSPNSIDDTMPTRPESLQRKSIESLGAIQLNTESVPRPSSPTADLFRKASSHIINNPPQRQPIQPNRLPATTEAQFLQKSMANLKLSTRTMESKSAQLPVQKNYPWYIPEVPQPPADPIFYTSRLPPEAEPKFVSPVFHRAAPAMLRNSSSVSATPDPVSLPVTPEPTPFWKFEYRDASPPTSPDVSFDSIHPTCSRRRNSKPR